MQGTCIDPSFPYCDTDGSVAGTPGACIAVTCTAGEFGKCVGDSELMCNQYGTGYDQVDCAHGCDENTGCKLCEANQTVCSNGAVASCDSFGNQTAVTQCPLGCFEDQPRCRDIDPSNRLAQYFDQGVNAPALDLTGMWTLDTDTGIATDNTGVSAAVTTTSFSVISPDGGPTMRVIVSDALTLGDIAFTGTAAPVFLAHGPVKVVGTVTVPSGLGSSRDVACQGKPGSTGNNYDGSCYLGQPGGGGGATAGASSGIQNDPDGDTPNAGGSKSGTDDLQPLVGGCSGGGFRGGNGGDNGPTAEGMKGGGAIQISSKISITVSGKITADGRAGNWYGRYPSCDLGFAGAGGGGGILLEAPNVTLLSHALLSATGGDGFMCTTSVVTGESGVGKMTCGSKGTGGDGTNAPGAGGDVTWVNGSSANIWMPGGGGGGAGRIRVNTASGAFVQDSTASLKAVVIPGTLKTR